MTAAAFDEMSDRPTQSMAFALAAADGLEVGMDLKVPAPDLTNFAALLASTAPLKVTRSLHGANIVFRYPGGDVFTGEFRNGVRHGRGTYR